MTDDQNKGWVKLHRKILDTELFKTDKTAMVVFIQLLLIVDRKTGSWTTGRFALAGMLGMNPNTLYSVLKRLQLNNKITLKSTNKYTKITVVNWKKYQQDDNNKSTTGQQQGNNRATLNKNRELRNIKAVANKDVEKYRSQADVRGLPSPAKEAIRKRLKTK